MGRGGSGGEGVLEGDIRIVVGDVVVVGRPIVIGRGGRRRSSGSGNRGRAHARRRAGHRARRSSGRGSGRGRYRPSYRCGCVKCGSRGGGRGHRSRGAALAQLEGNVPVGFSAQGLGELGLHVGFLHGTEGEVVLGGELDQKRARRRIEDRFGVHEQHAIGRLGLLQRGEDAGPEALQRRHVRERGDDLGRQRARGRRSGRRGGRSRCRRQGRSNGDRSRRRGNPFRRGGRRSALRERDRLAVARR